MADDMKPAAESQAERERRADKWPIEKDLGSYWTRADAIAFAASEVHLAEAAAIAREREREKKVSELVEIVQRLQAQQMKWLTPGGVNAMKTAFVLAGDLAAIHERSKGSE